MSGRSLGGQEGGLCTAGAAAGMIRRCCSWKFEMGNNLRSASPSELLAYGIFFIC